MVTSELDIGQSRSQFYQPEYDICLHEFHIDVIETFQKTKIQVDLIAFCFILRLTGLKGGYSLGYILSLEKENCHLMPSERYQKRLQQSIIMTIYHNVGKKTSIEVVMHYL